jgi:FkbM family methyltransferase
MGLLKPKNQVIAIRNGLKIRIRTIMDVAIIDEIFMSKIYDQLTFQLPKKNAMIVDVGAHIGGFSLYASLGENVKVYSYEPCPENYDLLVSNIMRNNKGNIHSFSQALAGTEGTRKLVIDPNNSGGHSFFRKGKSVRVECVTLDKVVWQIGHCDFLKMDCEGAEAEIFDRVDDRTLAKIDMICIEYHDPSRVGEIELRLTNSGFRVTKEIINDNVGMLRAKH